MENDVELSSMIRDEFQNGSDEVQAFMKICQKLEMDLPPYSIISDWLEHFRDLDFLQANEFQRNLLCAIICQYAKFTHAMFYRDVAIEDYMHEAIIQSRFKMVGDGSTNSFEIFDMFNEGLRMLETSINSSTPSKFYFPTLITHERILLNVVKDKIEHLLLLDAGFDQLKCSILEEVTLGFTCLQIILDSADKSRFLLREGELGNPTSIYKGNVADDKIHLVHEGIPFEDELFCCKLVEDRLFAFQYDVATYDWCYTEHDLSLNPPRKVNQWTCSGPLETAAIFEDSVEYVWSNNELYAARDFDSCFSIVVFDADTLTWTDTKFNGAGRVDKMEIDEDGLLSISATENTSETVKTNTTYRLPMRKPDKLRYIAWTKIRRQALFFGSDLYKKLNLPYTSEFREFSPNY